ncbi:MAG: U32 family peptidase [Deltaproteobacteria bacterium]|nr:U32 family peptidase [Deltaproteobacteria bacterium]
MNDTTSKRKMELLAPGGGVDAIKAAIIAGADAVYCGLEKFSARDRAANVPIDDMPQVVHLAHLHHCRIFVTLNIMLVEKEFSRVLKILHRLANAQVDGIIVQDIGLMYLIRTHFPMLPIHASTQLTTHNEGQVAALARLLAVRVNLCRELNLNEIESLSRFSHGLGVETEVFVHGANCLSFSGLCYMSSVNYGNSGNRGRCSQPCREEYAPTGQGWRFPLNLKDNTAYLNVAQLWDADVDSLKIEGRIKKSNYVYAVVRIWRQQLERLYSGVPLEDSDEALRTVYNRDLTNGFLTGNIHRDMFIDNPKDNSARYFLKQSGAVRYKEIKRVNQTVNDGKKALIEEVKGKIAALSIEKVPVSVMVKGEVGSPLCFTVRTPYDTFDVFSDTALFQSQAPASGELTADKTDVDSADHLTPPAHNQLNRKLFLYKLRAINGTAYQIDTLQLDELATGLCIGYEEIVRMKDRILYRLNGNRPTVEPVALPDGPVSGHAVLMPRLSVLISDESDLSLCSDTDATVHFELPNQLSSSWQKYAALLGRWPAVVPWFPAVLIGEDYTAAVRLLEALKPARIVTDNSGVGHAASVLKILWTAGPQLNIANSYALRGLKETLHCDGAFISSELNQLQLKSIPAVADMALHFSIFHPIPMMTSRQCLFHNVTGCEKARMDNECLRTCERTATLKNMKDTVTLIEKRQERYPRLVFNRHYLNTAVVSDLPNVFSSFLIDLTHIPTLTQMTRSKKDILALFDRHVKGDPTAADALHLAICPTTCNQYAVGV